MNNPVLANARAGPRIFVGKLSKDVSEQDVKEYFTKYGYVLDVYLPKSKDNKMEHRGFGFVTFETEAAVQRVVAHGMHKLKGSVIAIDVAVPRKEEIGVRPMAAQPGLGASRPVPPIMPQVPGPFLDPTSANLSQLLQQLQLSGGMTFPPQPTYMPDPLAMFQPVDPSALQYQQRQLGGAMNGRLPGQPMAPRPDMGGGAEYSPGLGGEGLALSPQMVTTQPATL